MVATREVDRLEHDEIASEGHAATCVARRPLEVDDAAIVGVRRIDRIMQPPDDALVAAGETEGSALGERRPLDHFQSNDLAERRGG